MVVASLGGCGRGTDRRDCHVGKESTQLDGEALEGPWRRVKVYKEPEPDERQEVLLPRLLDMPTAEIARRMGSTAAR